MSGGERPLATSAMAEAGLPSEPPPLFFIVGRGRSGTTLLLRMLNANPALFVPPEALFLVNLWRPYRSGPWAGERVRRFARDLWLEDRLRRWRLSAHELERRLLAVPAAERSFPRLCREVYAAAAAATGRSAAVWVGDKNPHHALFAGELAALFPAARFVHLVRDYRANVVSYRAVRFDLDGVGALARRWVLYNRAVLAAAQRQPERFLRLRYEDLLAAPEERLREVCAFLGVPFANTMLDHAGCDDQATLPWHAHLRVPLLPERAGAWRDALDARQVRRCDAVCRPLGELLGYPPAGPVRRSLAAMPGSWWGAVFTRLERALFRLPLRLRVAMIRGYRWATGNVIP